MSHLSGLNCGLTISDWICFYLPLCLFFIFLFFEMSFMSSVSIHRKYVNDFVWKLFDPVISFQFYVHVTYSMLLVPEGIGEAKTRFLVSLDES